MQSLKLKSELFYFYIAALFIYACFNLIPKPLQTTLTKYRVSALGLRLIDVTIIIILAVIWYAGLYGYSRFDEYSKLIKKDKDGKHVATLSKGLLLLVLWQPISSVVSSVLNYIAEHHTNLLPAVSIINHYISLGLPLGGFILISIGAWGLSQLLKWRPTFKAINVLAVLIIYTSVVYYRLVITTHGRSLVYHMSVWLILTTLIAPYIYMWFIGLLSAYEIYNYHRKSEGIVYRQSWKFVSYGLGWLIVTSILFQFLNSLTARLDHLSIYWLLAIIYSLLIILSMGFILIAVGTRQLKKIEEV
jgi:hypothetical protein